MISEQGDRFIRELIYALDWNGNTQNSMANKQTATTKQENELREFISALESKAAALEWRTIESAPKDGTSIILWDQRSPNGTRQSFAMAWDGNKWCSNWAYNNAFITQNQTHWMPLLPPPPETGT